MTGTRTTVVVALVLLAAVTTDAHAEGLWGEPATVGPAAYEIADPSVTMGDDGRALVAWQTPQATPCGSAHLATRAPDGTIADVAALDDDLAAAPVRVDATHVALLRRDGAGSAPCPDRVRLSVSLATTSGQVGAAHPLGTVARGDPVAVAAGPDGRLAVAWIDAPGDLGPGRPRPSHLRLAVRPAAGAFGPARRLAAVGGGTDAIGLAVGRAGRTVVAFFRERRSRHVIREVVAAVAPPRHRLGPFRVIGHHGGIGTLRAAITGRGRVAVAWGTQDGGEEADQPYQTYAALAGPDGRFAAPQRLDPGAGYERAPSPPVIAAAPDGTVTFAWSNVAAGHGLPLTYPVRVATAPPGARFGRATQLAPDGAIGDVAVARDGTTLVTWATGGYGAEHVQAALRAPGDSAFGPVEPVSGVDVAMQPRAAFLPDGRALVVWRHNPVPTQQVHPPDYVAPPRSARLRDRLRARDPARPDDRQRPPGRPRGRRRRGHHGHRPHPRPGGGRSRDPGRQRSGPTPGSLGPQGPWARESGSGRGIGPDVSRGG